MKRLLLILIAVGSMQMQASAQSCTQATPLSAGTCPGSTTATNNQTLTSAAYVIDDQHFGNYTINSGGTLYICAGAKLDVNNLNVNAGEIYIETGGTLIAAHMNTQGAIITNHGTFSTASSLYTSDNAELYNDGRVICGGLTIQGNSVLFTNNGVINLSGGDLSINTGGFVNNGLVLDANMFRINSAGLCLGDGSAVICVDFNNNASNSVVVNGTGTTAHLYIKGVANNNQSVTNTSNSFEVDFLLGCSGSNWGTAITNCNIPVPFVPTGTTVYFSKSTGSLHSTANWGEAADGSGTAPSNFTAGNVMYVIGNRTTADITSNWTVSGDGTVIMVGDKGTNVHFGINSADFNFSGAEVVIMPNSYMSIAATRSATFAATSTLQLTSREDGDASIGVVNGDISGLANNNVILNRYIPAAIERPWTFLASPQDIGQIDDNWQKQIHVTGPLGTGGAVCTDALASSQATANSSNGLDPTPSGNYSMYYVDPSVAPGGSGQWLPVTATNDNTPEFQLVRGRGYRVLVRGPREMGCYLIGTAATGWAPNREAITIKQYGSFNDITGGAGNVIVPLTTSNGNLYSLVGNPYACAIDFAALQSDASNSGVIDDKFWLYSPEKAAGAYSAYTAGVLTNRPSMYPNTGVNDDYIGMWQAFFVEQLSTGNDDLTFKESHKYTAAPFSGTFKTTATPIPDVLHVSMTTDADKSLDEVAIRLVNDPSVTNTNYSKYDARSLNDQAVYYLQTIKDVNRLAIHARVPLTNTNDTVALRVGSYQSGIFKFKAIGMGSFTNTDIFLLDRLNSTVQQLNNDSDYTFTIDITNTATFGSNRFAVIFRKQPNAVTDPAATRYKAYPSPVTDKLNLELPGNNDAYNIVITGMTGNMVYSGTMNTGQNTIDVRSFAAGAYVLKITDAGGKTEVIKVIKY